MRLSKLFIVILVISAVFGANIFGQVAKGLTEVNLVGSLSTMNYGGHSYTTTQIALSSGYFINKNFEVGGNVSLYKYERFAVSGTVTGFLSVHFPGSSKSKFVPFIGVQAGTEIGGVPDIIIGGFAGMKIFVSSGGGAFTIQPFFLHRGHINNFGCLLGVSIFL